MAENEIKDLTGFYKWVERCKKEFKEIGEAWTTSKIEFAEKWWDIHERRENKRLEPTTTVNHLREWADMLRMAKEQGKTLQEVHDEIKEVGKDTKKAGGVLQSLANIFKFGGGEMERHYPSKKK